MRKYPIFGIPKLNVLNIIITGGTKGIGRAISEMSIAKQANLAICSRSKSDLESLRDELQINSPQLQVLIYPCDLSIKEECLDFADFVLDQWDQVDVLINNAGIFIPGQVHVEEEGALESMMSTNLYSAYHLTRRILPRMISQGAGHVINICSIASLLAYPNGGSYSISKFALLGFSKVLREELKDKGIRVTAVLPGATWSNSWEGVDLPHNRLMEAKDIAIAVWGAIEMSPAAVMEEIIIRPQLGDL